MYKSSIRTYKMAQFVPNELQVQIAQLIKRLMPTHKDRGSIPRSVHEDPVICMLRLIML